MAAAADWTNLHHDLLTRIFLLLTCLADRVKFSTACKHWRSVALQAPTPLPWLLMPSTAVTSCYRIFGGFSDPRPSFADHPRGPRFCGAFPGGWFVVALEHIRGHALLNLRSGERVQLPDRVLFRDDTKCPVFVRVASMSAAPPAGGGAGACVVAALTVGQTNIVFCRPGMDFWSTTLTDLRGDAEDLTFHDGWFYAITPREELARYEVSPHADGAIKVRCQEMTVPESWQPQLACGESVVRYLLTSASGDLLMVKRYVHPAKGTWRFQVFTLLLEENRAVRRCYYLMRGQLLFVGRGCSKAFDTGNRQPGCIYFLDDVYPTPMSVLNQDRYFSNDTGSFSCLPSPKRPDQINRCLPRGPSSDSSPCIWYLQ